MENLKKLPILRELFTASKSNWMEALTELVITLFFSLMPIWLGCLIVGIIELPDTPITFIGKFAASSDLALLSASLIGPLLYMMFGTEKFRKGTLALPFPSGLWFLILIFFCCLIATVIYCFTYVSEVSNFFDIEGKKLTFTKELSVMIISFIIFFFSIFLVLAASVIRNSMDNPSRFMSTETQDFVDEFRTTQTVTIVNPAVAATDTADFVNAMQNNREQ